MHVSEIQDEKVVGGGGEDADSAPFVEDGRADKAAAFLREVVSGMGMRCKVHLEEPGDNDDESDICLQIEGPDAGRIIGKKGQTLAALQYLVYRVVNRSGLPRRHVLVDAEGYTQRREDTLAAMARRLGQPAVTDGKIITFEPMSPRDRRVVHLALSKFPGVVTQSQGEGNDRRVQIIPVRRLAELGGMPHGGGGRPRMQNAERKAQNAECPEEASPSVDSRSLAACPMGAAGGLECRMQSAKRKMQNAQRRPLRRRVANDRARRPGFASSSR
jgi:spoIIIJ-associated protein